MNYAAGWAGKNLGGVKKGEGTFDSFFCSRLFFHDYNFHLKFVSGIEYQKSAINDIFRVDTYAVIFFRMLVTSY